MISIQNTDTYVNVAVLGEFTLADIKDLEQHVLHRLKSEANVNLLVDLRDMVGYTLDVAWEELKFTRSHAGDFGRVAVVTYSQWLAWSAWLESLFTDADIEAFEDYDQALAWVGASADGAGEIPSSEA